MLGIVVLVVAVWLRRIPILPAVALIALLWAGLYYSYSQSSLAALFVAVLAIAAIAGTARRADRRRGDHGRARCSSAPP